jgi:hypothetical protein
MNKEPKTTHAWAWSDNEHPELRNISRTKYCQEVGPVVVIWEDDYEAMRKELKQLRALTAEYKALIKVCERCGKKDFHEFVRCGSLGLDYCESCYDEMCPK